jgi:histidine kinase/DNA gyrase B/HSP90-like ATPase
MPVVKVDTAMTSLRASGHDFNSAVGEVVDNSLEAGANVVQIRTFTAKKKIGNSAKAVEVIDRVAIGDDGEGMEGGDHGVLHRCLQMGYSTRYNSRLGLGRFGVGAKLAGISQAKKIEVYSRQSADSPRHYTFIDLREIEAGKNAIPVPVEAELPEDCRDLVGPDHGTLVVWSDADKLQERETGGARQPGGVARHLRIPDVP